MTTTARIIDETEVRRDHNPGSDIVVTDVEVLVTGARDQQHARSEARWRVEQDADGEATSYVMHTTEGPFDDGSYVIRATLTTLRYF